MPRNPTPSQSSLADWLAYQHQAAQEETAAKAAIGLGVLWAGLQFSNLAETAPAWLHGATLEIEKGFQQSAALAMDFVQHTLWASEPTAGVIPRLDLKFPVEMVQTSMRAAGPAVIRSKTTLSPELVNQRDIMQGAKLGTTGAGVRHVLNGGRGAVSQQVQLTAHTPDKNPQRVIGYARYTESGNGKNSPCYFCAMLASRGAVYSKNAFVETSKRFGDNVAAVHDHCQCSLRPVFRRADSLDARADLFMAQWDELTKGHSGREAMNAFRRGYVPPPPYKNAPGVDLGAVRHNRSRLIESGFAVTSPQVAFYSDAIEKLALSQAA